MSVTFAEVRKKKKNEANAWRERKGEREKSTVREVEGKGTGTEEKPHHIQASLGASYRCSPGLIFQDNQT